MDLEGLIAHASNSFHACLIVLHLTFNILILIDNLGSAHGKDDWQLQAAAQQPNYNAFSQAWYGYGAAADTTGYVNYQAQAVYLALSTKGAAKISTICILTITWGMFCNIIIM